MNSNDPKKKIVLPNIQDYQWESDPDDFEGEKSTAYDKYWANMKLCFHHFYDAIAQPKSNYWMGPKTAAWKQFMEEQPIVAKDGQ